MLNLTKVSVIWSLAGTAFHKQLIIALSGSTFGIKYFWSYAAMANNQAKYNSMLICACVPSCSLLVRNLTLSPFSGVWKAYLECPIIMNTSARSTDNICTDKSGLWHEKEFCENTQISFSWTHEMRW